MCLEILEIIVQIIEIADGVHSMNLQFLVDYYRRVRGAQIPDVLYHYTKPSVVEEFFKRDADFLCTRASHLNDGLEILAGARLFLDYLHRNNILSHGHCSLLDSLLGVVLEKLPVVPFIMSFSMDRNSPTQWEKYTDPTHGGFSVGFSQRELTELINNHMQASLVASQLEKFTQLLCPCFYQDVDDLDGYFEASIQASCGVFEDYARIVPSEARDAKHVAAVILSAAALVKVYDATNKWHDEHEWRIVYWPAVDSLLESVVYKEDKRPRVWAGMGGVKNPDAIRGAIVSLDVRPGVCDSENLRVRCGLLNNLRR